jgi:hypothetical protein
MLGGPPLASASSRTRPSPRQDWAVKVSRRHARAPLTGHGEVKVWTFVGCTPVALVIRAGRDRHGRAINIDVVLPGGPHVWRLSRRTKDRRQLSLCRPPRRRRAPRNRQGVCR